VLVNQFAFAVWDLTSVQCAKQIIKLIKLNCIYYLINIMALMYVLSQKGEKLLVHNHFIHRKEKTINEKMIWKYNDYMKFNCRGRAHTSDVVNNLNKRSQI
jgi:hypothetical protein